MTVIIESELWQASDLSCGVSCRSFTIDPLERDKDTGEANASLGDLSSQPPKRPRINRHRYPATIHSGLAKRTLPIDPQASDKSRPGRKD